MLKRLTFNLYVTSILALGLVICMTKMELISKFASPNIFEINYQYLLQIQEPCAIFNSLRLALLSKQQPTSKSHGY